MPTFSFIWCSWCCVQGAINKLSVVKVSTMAFCLIVFTQILVLRCIQVKVYSVHGTKAEFHLQCVDLWFSHHPLLKAGLSLWNYLIYLPNFAIYVRAYFWPQYSIEWWTFYTIRSDSSGMFQSSILLVLIQLPFTLLSLSFFFCFAFFG